jgi:hypothetical protein
MIPILKCGVVCRNCSCVRPVNVGIYEMSRKK